MSNADFDLIMDNIDEIPIDQSETYGEGSWDILVNDIGGKIIPSRTLAGHFEDDIHQQIADRLDEIDEPGFLTDDELSEMCGDDGLDASDEA